MAKLGRRKTDAALSGQEEEMKGHGNIRRGYSGDSLKLTMSYGLAECKEDKRVDSFLGDEESKLSMGKASGKNSVIF